MLNWEITEMIWTIQLNQMVYLTQYSRWKMLKKNNDFLRSKKNYIPSIIGQVQEWIWNILKYAAFYPVKKLPALNIIIHLKENIKILITFFQYSRFHNATKSWLLLISSHADMMMTMRLIIYNKCHNRINQYFKEFKVKRNWIEECLSCF